MLSDAHWMSLEPLVEACRPKGKTQPKDLRRTLSAIVWRHQNGAKWRAIPAELGPWSRAAQTFIRAAGAEKKGPTARGAMSVRRWAVRVAAEPAPDLIRGHQGVRDRRRARTRGGLHPGAGPSPRAAPCRSSSGALAGRAAVGGGGPGSCQPRLSRAHLVPGRASGDPAQAERSPGGLPGVGLQQSQLRRTALGAAERVAGGGAPL